MQGFKGGGEPLPLAPGGLRGDQAAVDSHKLHTDELPASYSAAWTVEVKQLTIYLPNKAVQSIVNRAREISNVVATQLKGGQLRHGHA